MSVVIVDGLVLHALVPRLKDAGRSAIRSAGPLDLAEASVRSGIGTNLYDRGLSAAMANLNICWTSDSSYVSQLAGHLADFLAEYVEASSGTESSASRALDGVAP